MQGPILVELETSGNVTKSIFCNLDKVSKLIFFVFKSEIWEERSLILPFLSRAAGYSLPLFPHLNNFILLSLLYSN